MQKTRLIAPALFSAAIGGNYALHKSGLPTLCSGTIRPVLHTDTKPGRALGVAIYAGISAWFIPHLFAPKHNNTFRGIS